jgi:hypothetical protein
MSFDPYAHFDANLSLERQLSVARWNILMDRLRSNELVPGVGTLVQRVGGGVAVSVKKTRFPSPPMHPYFVSDASVGSMAQVSITPGTHSGVVPTIEGQPMNVTVGTPPAYPVLTLAGSETLLYFQIDYSGPANVISDVSIHGTDSTTWESLQASVNLVLGTAGTDYKFLSSIFITSGDSASVGCANDGVSGSQAYAQCGMTSNCWLV